MEPLLLVTQVKSLMVLLQFFLLEEILPRKWVLKYMEEFLLSQLLVFHPRLWELDQL
jgi:hypothetical protein